MFESCSTTNERGLGLGVGLETDADRGIDAGWSAGLHSSGLAMEGAGVEALSESRDVCLVSFPLLSLQRKKSVDE